MIKNKKVLAIITARKGSKGLPHKNFRPFACSNLTEITINVAKRSKYIDLIFLSSDSQNLAEICDKNAIENFGSRPAQIALDNSTSYEVVKHSIELLANRGEIFDIIALLEPTSPLRKVSDIDKCIRTLEKNSENFDSLVTVGEVKEHPDTQFLLDGYKLQKFNFGSPIPINRQTLGVTYFPYGICYVSKIFELLEQKTFYHTKTMAIVMPKEQCIDIDDEFDFKMAEIIYKEGEFQNP
jgi:CMP-N,N'-diacetyllegionaminic acid synthase